MLPSLANKFVQILAELTHFAMQCERPESAGTVYGAIRGQYIYELFPRGVLQQRPL